MAVDDPAFDGHFPGDPLLPGARLLDRMLRVMTEAGAIDRGTAIEGATVKFLAPVRPGDRVHVGWQAGERGLIRFECTVAGVAVASGSFRPQAAVATAAAGDATA